MELIIFWTLCGCLLCPLWIHSSHPFCHQSSSYLLFAGFWTGCLLPSLASARRKDYDSSHPSTWYCRFHNCALLCCWDSYPALFSSDLLLPTYQPLSCQTTPIYRMLTRTSVEVSCYFHFFIWFLETMSLHILINHLFNPVGWSSHIILSLFPNNTGCFIRT